MVAELEVGPFGFSAAQKVTFINLKTGQLAHVNKNICIYLAAD